ncbi:hypothetical protein FRC02_001552 [Tulasnella sp. 418]|nr:hypothetical protein FRC02_001552 [Tulasnella sp. 418]
MLQDGTQSTTLGHVQPILTGVERQPGALEAEELSLPTKSLLEKEVDKVKDETPHRNTESIKEEGHKCAPKLVPNQVSGTINDHAQFWTTYDRVSGAFDREFIDAWNKSLDVLLIFAGLFSAINTAFIMESYKGVKPDPAEITNDLLRLLILHRSDNVTLSSKELYPGTPSSSAVPINSIFFSSLSFSLTAAFGAVTAKQWLTEYTNVGAMKALHIQGRTRQEKYNGLKSWHVRFIIELLPVFLQLSVLLFLIGVVDFLWEWDRKVATVQLALSCAGLALYCATIIIGVLVPSSPFQTPLPRYVPRYFWKIYGSLRSAIHKLSTSHWMNYLQGALGQVLHGFKTLFRAAYLPCSLYLSIFWPNNRSSSHTGWLNQSSVHESVEGLGDVPIFHFMVRADSETERSKWDSMLVTAAEAVVWLLERVEHPDVTITALDAVRLLPPSLIHCLIREREGLLERLIAFHHSILPSTSSTTDLSDWLTAWPDAAVVSALAWRHILWAEPFEPDVLAIRLRLSDLHGPSHLPTTLKNSLDPLLAAKCIMNVNSSEFSTFQEWDLLRRCMGNVSVSSMVPPYNLRIKYADTSRALMNDHFVTTFSPLQLALESVILLSGLEVGMYRFSFSDFPFLTSLLHGDLSNHIVSYVAIAIAAINSIPQNFHKLYISDSDFGAARTRRLVEDPARVLPDIMKVIPTEIHRLRFHSPDEGLILPEHVALALSTVTYSSYEAIGIFKALLGITSALFDDKFEYTRNPIPYPYFPQDLVQLARLSPNDAELQSLVSNLLCKCNDGNWIALLHDDSGQDIKIFLQSIPRPTSQYCDKTDSHVGRLLELLQAGLEDTELVNISRSFTALQDYLVERVKLHSAHPLSNNIIFRIPFQRLLKIYDDEYPSNSPLLQTQISYVMMVLIIDDRRFADGGHLLLEFFDILLAKDADLCWPAYFTAAGLAGVGKEAHDLIVNTFDAFTIYPAAEDGRRLWRGESSLLVWTKAKKARHHDDSPTRWESSLFFSPAAAVLMLEYWSAAERLKQRDGDKYSGIDYTVLKGYLEAVLQDWETSGEGGTERGTIRKQIEETLQNLKRPSTDAPSQVV